MAGKPGDVLGILRRGELQAEAMLNPRERDLFNAYIMQARLQYLNLLLQPGLAGRFDTAIAGAAIGAVDRWVPLFTNKFSQPVSVVIGGQFVNAPGQQVKLSISGNNSAADVMDYLGNTANAPSFNKRLSNSILIVPGRTLYINTADTGIAIDAASLFTVRVFNPAEFLTADVWESR